MLSFSANNRKAAMYYCILIRDFTQFPFCALTWLGHGCNCTSNFEQIGAMGWTMKCQLSYRGNLFVLIVLLCIIWLCNMSLHLNDANITKVYA